MPKAKLKRVPMFKTKARSRKEVLDRMAKILSGPERWTKCNLARELNGQVTYPDSTKASSFCLLGAMERAKPGVSFAIKTQAFIEKFLGLDIASFNDNTSTTFADIKAVLTKAQKELSK